MKRNTILWFFSLLLLQGTFLSCNNWLDLESDSDILEDKLFEEYEGFRSSVNGIYRLLGEPNLYARNLTWGMASVLGNNYNESNLPTLASASFSLNYSYISTGDYANSTSMAIIDPVWESGYRVIANCNNLIAHVLERDTSFFPQGKVERDLILGEMLGVRALVHFDLLRLFAPATALNDSRSYIPYVTQYPERQPLHLTVQKTLEFIIADLEESKSLLAYNDTLYNAGEMESVTNRMGEGIGDWNYVDPRGGSFFTHRATRMNYFSATALLARAYQWRNGAGDMEKAYRAARDMYRFSSDKGWFRFTPAENLQTSADNISRKMYDDILFAANYNQMYSMLTDKVLYPTGKYFFYKNQDHLFGKGTPEDDSDDFRYVMLIDPLDKSSRRWTRPDTETTANSSVSRVQGSLAPVIRMSEAVYIMCECLADTNLPEAVELLAAVRMARGAKTLLPEVIGRTEFLERLYIEMTREFMSEGQTFFLYKRLNRPMYNGASPAVDMTNRYVLPIPHSETAYLTL